MGPIHGETIPEGQPIGVDVIGLDSPLDSMEAEGSDGQGPWEPEREAVDGPLGVS